MSGPPHPCSGAKHTLCRNGLTQCPEISGTCSHLRCIEQPGFWGQDKEKRQIIQSSRSRNHSAIRSQKWTGEAVSEESSVVPWLLWSKPLVRQRSNSGNSLAHRAKETSGGVQPAGHTPPLCFCCYGGWFSGQIPTGLHLDICEKNLELLSSRNHMCVARGKACRTMVSRFCFRLQTGLLVGIMEHESFPFLVSLFFFLNSFSFFLFFPASIQNDFAYWFGEYSKGSRQSKSYFAITHSRLDV